MPKLTTKERIYVKIAQQSGTTSVGLLAADLGYTPRTVRQHVRALEAEGRVEVGWDGQQLEITADEQRAIRLGLGLCAILK